MTQEEFDSAIGIDLGTTYSCAAVMENDRVEVIVSDRGNRTTPSCVTFTNKECVVGEAAKSKLIVVPENTIFDIKRMIGRRFDDEEVQNDIKHWPFKVVDSGNNTPVIQVKTGDEVKTFTPEEISAKILLKLKEAAEKRLDNKKVKKAVITVPAYFNNAQREATKAAGELAGLEVLRIINEPTAAAIAYAFDRIKDDEEHNVLIFDLGGGTFDVTILSIKGRAFIVKATGGDTHLGGENFNQRLYNFAVEEFKRNHNIDLCITPKLKTELLKECERAKCALSSEVETELNIDAFANGIDLLIDISREEFEQLCKDEFSKILPVIESFLQDAIVSKRDIDDVVLVGGSSRIPKVKAIISDYFDGKELKESINPNEAVTYGAAIMAHHLCTDQGNNSSSSNDIYLLDVMPYTLGTDIRNNEVLHMIKRNTPLPVKVSKFFTTEQDNQSRICIKVYEGEANTTDECHLLGTFDLSGIPPAPRGVPQIEVTFDLDANGILNVSAEEKETGKRNQITVTNDKGRLSKGEIDRMVNEAAKYEAQDRDERKRVKIKDELQNYAYSMKNTINDTNIAGKFEESDKQALSTAIEETLQWLTNNQDASKEEYDHHRKELEGKCKSILTKMYSTQAKLETIASYLCCNDDVSDSNCTNSVIFNFAASHPHARKAVMQTLHGYNIPGLSIKLIKQKQPHKQNNHVIVNGSNSNNSEATNQQNVNAATTSKNMCVITLEWPGDSEDVPECLSSVAWWLLQQQHFYCCQEYNVDLHIKVSPGGHMGALPRPSDVVNKSNNNTNNTIATNANNVNCNAHVDWRLLYNSLHSFTVDMSDWSFGLDELQNAVNLQRITLRDTKITTLRWLKYCKQVRQLTLDSCNALLYLDDVANLFNLNMFVATNCTFRNIFPLHVCKELNHLHLEDTTHTGYMSIINYMPHIKVLQLTKSISLVVDLDKLKELQELCTEGDVHITEPHTTLQVLTMKRASSAIRCIDVMLPNLTKLVLEEFSITSLELASIFRLQHLKHLHIEASSEHKLTSSSILKCMVNALQELTLLNYTIETIVDDILWHNITKLITPGLTINDFNALRDCHHLTELDVQVKEEEMCAKYHYNGISHVKKLTLHCSKIHLQKLLFVCKELEALTFDYCTVNATSTEPIAVTIDNVQLCKLTLEECTGLQSLSFASVHSNLTQLSVVNCNELESVITATCCEEQQEWQAEHITDAAAEEERDNNNASSTQTTTLLDHCPSLHNVNIEGCSKLQMIVMARTFQELMQEVKCNGGQIGVMWGLEGKYNATTHTLDVYDKSLPNVALSSLAENVYTINVISSSTSNVLDSLDQFTQLQKLNISSCRCITSLNLANPLDKLTTLIASHTALHDFHFLELMPNLTHLELDNCFWFTESNLLLLLHNHTNLEELSVQNTDITDLTIDNHNLTKLRYLNAKGCNNLHNIYVDSKHSCLNEMMIVSSLDVNVANLPKQYYGKDFVIATKLDLSGIKQFGKLTDVTIISEEYCLQQENVHMLWECTELEELNIHECMSITELNFTKEMLKLTIVNCNASSLTRINGLQYCCNLEETDISGCENITSLKFTVPMIKLKLIKANNSGLTQIDGLQYCTNLEEIFINECANITSLTFTVPMTKLRVISAWSSGLTQIDGLQYCTNLEEIDISDCENITSLTFTASMTKLRVINAFCLGLTRIDGLQYCCNLEEISISGCENITSLAYTAPMTKLRVLKASCIGLTQINGLNECTDLEEINISDCKNFTELTFTVPMMKLRAINASRSGLTAINKLEYCYNLEEITIIDCKNITSLTFTVPMTKLRVIHANISGLTLIDGLQYCCNLEHINIKECKNFTELTFTVPMTKLRVIHANISGLTLIDGLQYCCNLEEIDISDCTNITSLTFTVPMIRLRVIHANISGLTHIDGLQFCRNLELFFISDCKHITSLTFTVPMMKLRVIKASDSGLKQIHGLEYCTNLNQISKYQKFKPIDLKMPRTSHTIKRPFH